MNDLKRLIVDLRNVVNNDTYVLLISKNPKIVEMVRTIIYMESESWIKEIPLFKYLPELSVMWKKHTEGIASLSSVDEIDRWLREYRQITLGDWFESL